MTNRELQIIANTYKDKADSYLQLIIDDKDIDTTYYAQEYLRYKSQWIAIKSLLE